MSKLTRWLRSIFRRDRNLDNVLKRQLIQIRMTCVEHATRIDAGDHYDNLQIRRVLTDIAHALMAAEGTVDESLGVPPWWETNGTGQVPIHEKKTVPNLN